MRKPERTIESSTELLTELTSSNPDNHFQIPKNQLYLPAGFTRISIYFVKSQYEQLKIYSWWHRISVRTVLDLALTEHLESFLNQNEFNKITPVNGPFRRTTVVVKDRYWEIIKDLAWKNKSLTKYVLAQVLTEFFKDKELPSPPPNLSNF